MEDELKNPDSNLTKKEKLMLSRNLAKIERNLGGIKEMGRVPDAIVVIDVKKEHLAVAEATKLNIPVVAVVDSNCSPDDVNFVIPGNDDAVRSIALYLELFSRSVLSGLEAIIAGSALSSKDIKPTQQEKEKSREKQKEKRVISQKIGKKISQKRGQIIRKTAKQILSQVPSRRQQSQRQNLIPHLMRNLAIRQMVKRKPNKVKMARMVLPNQ